MVLASSFTAAFLIIKFENNHYENLVITIKLIKRVKNTASFYNKSFSDIIKEIAESGDFKNADYISEFLILPKDGITPPEAWQKAVKNSKLNLTGSEKETLIKFGSDMCSCSKEKIEEYGKEAIEAFTEFKTISEEKREKKSKTTAVITAAAGIITVLMFI